MAKKDKEVGKPGSMGTREDSFGSAPGKISVAGGEMCMFGYKINEGVWPPAPTSTDSKTGYPKDYQKSTKAPK